MPLAYNPLSVYDYDTMSLAEYNDLLLDPAHSGDIVYVDGFGYAISGIQSPFMGDYISSLQSIDKGYMKFQVVFDDTDDFVICDDKVFLYGMPISLSQNEGGIYAIRVISEENLAIIEDPTYSIMGNPFVLSQYDESRWVVSADQLSYEATAGYVMWGGMPIAMTDKGALVVVSEHVDSRDDYEQEEMMWEGIPVVLGRKGDNLFLVLGL